MKKQQIAFFMVLILVLSAVISTSTSAASKIKLNKTNITLAVGAKTTIKIKGTKKKVTFKSSKKSVAKVSKKGVVTAKKAGKATITAKVSGKNLTCKVTVKKTSDAKTVTKEKDNTTSQSVAVVQKKIPVTTEKQETITEQATTEEKKSDVSKDKEVVAIVNEERAKQNLSAITMDENLNQAAQKRAAELVQSFSHTRPNGTSCFTVLGEFGISYMGCGENIAAGQSSSETVMDSWMNSDGHRKNILGNYSKMGVGYVSVKGGYGHYWVQIFVR